MSSHKVCVSEINNEGLFKDFKQTPLKFIKVYEKVLQNICSITLWRYTGTWTNCKRIGSYSFGGQFLSAARTKDTGIIYLLNLHNLFVCLRQTFEFYFTKTVHR
jgi:hypothetical protein